MLPSRQGDCWLILPWMKSHQESVWSLTPDFTRQALQSGAILDVPVQSVAVRDSARPHTAELSLEASAYEFLG